MTREVTESKTIKGGGEVHAIGKIPRLPEFRENIMLLKSFVNKCPAVIFFRDIEGNLILVNEKFARLFDLDGDAVIGKKDAEILPAAMLQALRIHDELVLEKRTSEHFEYELTIQNEKKFYFCMKFPLHDDDAFYGTACIATDITDRKQDTVVQRRWEDVFSNVRIGLAVLKPEDNTIELINPALARMHGYTTGELKNRPIIDLFAPEGLKIVADCLASVHDDSSSRESMHRRKDGSEFPVLIDITSVAADKGEVLYRIVNVQDITARKQAEENLRYQAYHDLLTGLPNRDMFLMYLDLEITQARRNDYKIAVLYLDVDRFKNVVDSLGHAAGDKLLKETGARLGSCIRKSDTIGRIGGDDFAILLSDYQRPEDVVINIREIVAAMNAPFQLGSHEFYITLSIGISMFPGDGQDSDTLLKNADNAMFQAKEAGRNSYHFFNAELNKRTVENLILENSLRKAIERDELLVYYQPQMNLKTEQIDCLEALVRWKHPDLGLLRPEQFLLIAEENGFISKIDLWVLQSACAQNKAWQNAGLKHIPVSVNLSARELHDPDLIANISRVLGETGLDSAYLEIEVTETNAMYNIERALSNMDKLREMGVGLAIDDFGTGFSSLNYLKKLPIKKIKIDKSFVKGVVSDDGDQAIVSAVIAMGKNLKLYIVAEGVEKREQLEFFKSKHCDAVQGFYFSEPLPAKRFNTLLPTADGEKERNSPPGTPSPCNPPAGAEDNAA